MNYTVEINRLTAAYNGFEALTNISIRLEENKIYGLIGRNGAGKSTLLSIIASYMEPSAGSLTIGGADPFENAEVMRQVAFIHQTNYSSESENVKGMLEAAERYRPRFDREYADKLAKLFKLPLDKPMKELSNGMQSAVNVTIGLACRAPITIFDEAYVGMDAPTRDIFYKQLLEDHERHPRTVILSTHLVSEMDYLFEQVAIIHKGKLLLHEPIDELVERGASITGTAHAVDAFVKDLKPLQTQQLGGTKSVMVYGELTEEQRAEARKQGLDVGPVSLQELFIHLTGGEEE